MAKFKVVGSAPQVMGIVFVSTDSPSEALMHFRAGLRDDFGLRVINETGNEISEQELYKLSKSEEK